MRNTHSEICLKTSYTGVSNYTLQCNLFEWCLTLVSSTLVKSQFHPLTLGHTLLNYLFSLVFITIIFRCYYLILEVYYHFLQIHFYVKLYGPSFHIQRKEQTNLMHVIYAIEQLPRIHLALFRVVRHDPVVVLVNIIYFRDDVHVIQ